MPDPPAHSASTWNRLKLGGGVLRATVVFGVCGYMLAGWRLLDAIMLAGWRLLDAIYMVVITVFGVGYGEVRAVESDGLRIFTITLIVAGCSALIYILNPQIPPRNRTPQIPPTQIPPRNRKCCPAMRE